jgi:hypothetical protein
MSSSDSPVIKSADISVKFPSPTNDDVRAERQLVRAALKRGPARMSVNFRLYTPEDQQRDQAKQYQWIKGSTIVVRCSSAEAVAAVRRKVEEALREIDGARLQVAED